jgi:hypothetical protein
VANKCPACGRGGYRTVTYKQAWQMARDAGLYSKAISRCGFREGMAEHAAKLCISIFIKTRKERERRGEK